MDYVRGKFSIAFVTLERLKKTTKKTLFTIISDVQNAEYFIVRIIPSFW